MLLSSLLQVIESILFNLKIFPKNLILSQNTTFNEAIYSAWGNHGPSRTAMPSISRLQKMVEAAWAQGFDVQVIYFYNY